MSIEHSAEAIWITDYESGEVLYTDSSDGTILGQPRDILYEGPLSFLGAIHPKDRGRIVEANDVLPASEYDEVYRIICADETERWVRDYAVPLQNSAGKVTYIARIVRDITDQKRKHSGRRRYDDTIEALARNFPDIAFVIDKQGYYREYLAGSESEPLLYKAPDKFLGKSLHDVLPGDVADRIHSAVRESLETDTLQTVEFQLDVPAGQVWFEGRLTPIEGTEIDQAVVYVGRDITDRVEREREIAYQWTLLEALQETVLDGLLVVNGDREVVTYNDRFVDLWDLPTEIIEEDDDGLAIEWVLDQIRNPEEFLNRVEYLYDHPDETSRDEIELMDGRVFDRYSSPVTGEKGTHYGRLWMFRDITSRKEREIELERLNRINTITRSISQAIIAAETREEIEEATCNQLAAADMYECAVVGEFSSSYHRLTIRAISSAQRSNLDSEQLTITDASIDHNPAVDAAKTREAVTVRNRAAIDQELWNGISEDWDSFTVVPIVYETLVYGVLVIFAGRQNTFDDEDVSVLEELGETIGHAINSIDRRQVLVADEVIEVEFSSTQYGDAFADLSKRGGRASIDRVIPLQENTQALYITVEGANLDFVEPYLEQLPEVTDVRIIGDGDDGSSIEVHTEGETIPKVIAEYGGRVRNMQLSDGELSIAVELPPDLRLRPVIDRLQEVDPTLSVVAHRTVAREGETPGSLQTLTTEELPERQRIALELGYFGGYFDWPRGSTGEELAEQLDVSAPTYHYHLRRGERKLLELLFDKS